MLMDYSPGANNVGKMNPKAAKKSGKGCKGASVAAINLSLCLYTYIHLGCIAQWKLSVEEFSTLCSSDSSGFGTVSGWVK